MDHWALTNPETCHRKGHLKVLQHHHHRLPGRGPEPVGGDHAGDDGQDDVGQDAPAADVEHGGASVSDICGETELKRGSSSIITKGMSVRQVQVCLKLTIFIFWDQIKLSGVSNV